ncbi:helix-turn-helix domain-containing protein [Pseudalkalibacillus caeni]|uniref:Helix-turn-helix domain-containing protein n=1 Tax=Exobacillus caeni TaxID=2574798 RepID=A0A5R9EV47_9BACL|nr:helix-turn-helix domain-containing protein [Pseudalkalibacillus caeni]TLS34937.1 helix-turn-helix domain-containing protein [Pseudalkalibacillus caeni]
MNEGKLRYYRKLKGLTQEQLAHGICSVSYLSKIENGSAQSSDNIINLLFERLGISVEKKEKKNHEATEALLYEWYNYTKARNQEKALAWKEKVEAAKFSQWPPELLSKYNLFLLRYYLLTLEIDKAEKIVKKLQQSKEHFSYELSYYYHAFLGILEFKKQNLNGSKGHYKKAEQIGSNIGIKSTELAELYYLTALTEAGLHNQTVAIPYASRAIKIFDEEYNFVRSADSHILLGIIYRRISQYQLAEDHFQKALKVTDFFSENIFDKRRKGLISHNLGYLYSCMNKSNKAIDYYLKALDLSSKDHEQNDIMTIYLLAKEYYKIQAIEEAKEWAEKGMELVEKYNDRKYCYYLKVLDHQINKNKNEDYEELLRNEAIPYFTESKNWLIVAEMAQFLADYYFEKFQYKSASEYYRLVIDAKEKVV